MMLAWIEFAVLLYFFSCLERGFGDPYRHLGISHSASSSEIKKAYKRLAKQWHPDRNKDKGAQSKFVEISDAYKLLSDPVKRNNYDRYGREEGPPIPHRNPFRHQSGFNEFKRSDGSRAYFHQEFSNFDDYEPPMWKYRRSDSSEPVQDLSTRIWNKLKLLPGKFLNMIFSEKTFQFSSLVLTCLAIAIALSLRKSDAHRSTLAGDDETARKNSPHTNFVQEMTAQSYHRLLRLQRPGCRTVVVLVDEETKVNLVKEFTEVVYPYRNSKTLTFAYIHLDKYLNWFKSLLMASDVSLGFEPMDVQVKNCRGTVLVLNNYKKIFSVFHAKVAKLRKSKFRGAEFLGFQTESESDEPDIENQGFRQRKNNNNKTFTSDNPINITSSAILEGLSDWLERGFDGYFVKIPIGAWPQLTSGESPMTM